MTDELNRRQYVCPSCFAQRTWNDVFFRRNVLRSEPDLRSTRLYRCLRPEEEPARESFSLADWRTCPAHQRISDGGVITGLRDYSGEVLTVRVCPVCHYPLPDPDAPLMTLLPWSSRGLAWEEGIRFMELLEQLPEQFRTAKKDAEPLSNPLVYLQALTRSGAVLQLPVGLRDGRQDRLASLRTDYFRRAAAGLVFLEAEPLAGEPLALDLAAQRTLADYAEASGAGDFRLARPTVWFVRIGSEPARDAAALQTELEAYHPALLNGIRLLTPCSIILPWDDSPETAAAAAAFLTEPSVPDAQPEEVPQPEEPQSEEAPSAADEDAPVFDGDAPAFDEDDELPVPGDSEPEPPEERSIP